MVGVILLFLFEGLICFATGLNSASAEALEAVSLVLMAINTVALFVYISTRYKGYDSYVVYALLLSLILKVALLLWDYYATNIFILPNSHSDSESYHIGAVLFANGDLKNVENYSYLVGIIYRYFGMQRMTAQYTNIILSFWGIEIFDGLLDILEISHNAKSRTMVLVALLPNYMIMSAILIRECIISFILCVSLYAFALWWSHNRTLYFFIAEVVSLMACWFHAGAIAVTIGIAIAWIISGKDENGSRRIKLRLSSIVFAILFFIGFMYLFNSLSGSLLKRFQGLRMDAIDSYIEGHNFYAAGNNTSNTSTYTASITNRTGLIGILLNSPIRIIYFLWVPMPWSIRGLGDIIAFIGSSIFYGGIIFATAYDLIIRGGKKENRSLLITVFVIALCGAMVFAWGTDSAGTALRHREKFFFVYLLLYAVYQQRHAYKKEQNVIQFANDGGYVR